MHVVDFSNNSIDFKIHFQHSTMLYSFLFDVDMKKTYITKGKVMLPRGKGNFF